jgi:hypothetical protein
MVNYERNLPMRKIRAFALAVALALAAFYLASAPVSAADTAVHIKGKASASGRVDPAAAGVTEEGSGTLSHLGNFSYRLVGTGTVNNDGTYSAGGDITIVSANGDQLSGPYTVTGTATDTANTATAVMTITGGTGRFANASGTLTLISEGPPLSPDGQFFVFDVANTWDGQIVKGPKPAQAAQPESSNDVAAVAPRSPHETTPPPAATTEPPANTPVLPDASPSPGTTASTGTSATEPNPWAGPSTPRPEAGKPKPRPEAGKPGDSTISGPGQGRVNGAPSGTSASQSGGAGHG